MSASKIILRIARPTDNLSQLSKMYQEGLSLEILSRFNNHDGFDGIILGHPNYQYHLEFTHHQGVLVGKCTTKDNLLVFYMPDKNILSKTKHNLVQAGFIEVDSYNSYWDKFGVTFEDIDGYRVVLCSQAWAR